MTRITPGPNPLADLSVTPRLLSDLARNGGWHPTGALGANAPRQLIAAVAAAALTSGTLRLAGGIVLPGGRPVSSISFLGGTAPVTPTNDWFCIVAKDLTLLATTVDAGTAAWTASTAKTLQIATTLGGSTGGGTYTPANAVEVYFGLVQVATTVGTVISTGTGTAAGTLAPMMAGDSNTGLTDPASLVSALVAGKVASMTFKSNTPYCYWS